MRPSGERGGSGGGGIVRNVKSAQTRVVECLNFWMSLPDTNMLVKSLVDESFQRAGLAASSSSPSTPTNPARSPTLATPPAQPGPSKPNPRLATANGSAAADNSSEVAAADEQHNQQQNGSSSNGHSHQQLTAKPAVRSPRGGGANGGDSPDAATSSSASATAKRQHQSPNVQHYVDEMDFAHRIGAISPRQAQVNQQHQQRDETATTSSDGSKPTKQGSSPKPAPLYPTTAGQSPLQDHLTVDNSGLNRARSPDALILNEPKASPEAHHFESTGNSSTSGLGGMEQRAKSEQTARIEAAVKHQQDDIALPRATIADIPRFYVPPSSRSSMNNNSSNNNSGSASSRGGNNNFATTAPGTGTTSNTNNPSSAMMNNTNNNNQNLLIVPSTAAAAGTPSGLTEQQEIAIFTRIVNALANAGARKVPPKSAGAKISRQHSAAPAGGMTPLNAIVQITTESFGLPGVFAKIIHAKLVYGGRGCPQVPLTLNSVRSFYESYIHGNSIERRMFEVLLGASEINFPVPAATTLFAASGGGGSGSAAGAGAGKAGSSRPGTASSRSAALLANSQNNSSNSNNGNTDNTSNNSATSVANGRQYLVRADFAPLLQILLDHHPGLAFLKQTTDFQSRYLETVIIRIFFELDKSDVGRISWEEFRRSSLPAAIRKADSNEDINLVLDFFSYEHFYVLYCRFWELDTDKDFLISKEDLMRYYPENTTNPIIVERIAAGVGRPLKSSVKGRMNFEDFVWFCLCEEHKAHPRAIAYWFRILDVDQDGIISGYELEMFYQHTKEKMKMLTTESIVFDDVMCQVSDMMSFSRRAQPGGSGGAATSSSATTANNANSNTGSSSSSLHNSQQQHGGSFHGGRPGTAGARPRSAAPTGSAARLMSAAPSSRPVVGTDPREERRLSIVGGSISVNSADGSNAAAGNNNNNGGKPPSTSSDAAAAKQQSATTTSSSSSPSSRPPGAVPWSDPTKLRLHAGFTLSDFQRCPTAAHVAINMLTNVSKFLQFEQRDPFVASHERPGGSGGGHGGGNSAMLEGMLLNPNNQLSGPLERTEWDRFCRAEYDRMAADDEAP